MSKLDVSHTKLITANKATKIKNETGSILTDKEAADKFNTFFTDKISGLQEKIDKNMSQDPIAKLKSKLENRAIDKLQFKTVTE